VVPVSLTVRSRPEGARVLRADTGEVLGVTPWVASLPPSAAPLGLRVELAGYTPSEHKVTLESSATLEVPLVPVPVVARPARGAQHTTRAAAARKPTSGSRDAVIDPFAP